jgi:hypothetical protein
MGGTILQFLNNNGTDCATSIGMIRLKIADIARIPAYLTRYKNQVRQTGARFLDRHLRDTHCPAALGETLCADDYSISFMVASLTPRGAALHPYRREGPMGFCVFPGLVEPVFLRHLEDGSADYAYVVNVYVHLLDASKRRGSIRSRQQVEVRQSVESMLQPAKKPRIARDNRLILVQQPDQGNFQALSRKMDIIAAQVSNPPQAQIYPPLPPSQSWPAEDYNVVKMPDA